MSTLETIRQNLRYIFALLLIIILPLHLLEHHVPSSWSIQQPPRSPVLWLLLIFASYHGLEGFRSVMYDYVSGKAGRIFTEIVYWILLIIVLWVGGVGLIRSFGW